MELGLFDNFYATPQLGDGCAESIVRAYRQMIVNGENLISKRLKTSYLGVKYLVDELKAGYELLKRPYERSCNHLEEGGVIALCHDGAEYGPRALGHRSFLADPSNKKMLTCLNTIKGREWWRPLAPIVPEEILREF